MKRKQKSKPVQIKPRKILRKEKRQQKKANRVHFQQKKKLLNLQYKELLKQKQQSKSQNDKRKKHSNEGDKNIVDSTNMLNCLEQDNETISIIKRIDKKKKIIENKKNIVHEDRLQRERIEETKKQNKFQKEMSKRRVAQLKLANEEEDKIIRKLEKQLKIDRNRKDDKRVPKMFNDGLEYALEMCLPGNIEKMYVAAKEAAAYEHFNDFDKDFSLITGNQAAANASLKRKMDKETGGARKKMDMDQLQHTDIDDSDLESSISDSDSMADNEDECSVEHPGKFVKTPSYFDNDSETNNNSSNMNKTSKQEAEDIYGRVYNENGLNKNEISKYIPPHLRSTLLEDDAKHQEKFNRLHKQLKGHLNRLSQSNMYRVASDIESLYMQHSRFYMNKSITTLLLDSLISNVISPERLVLEHTLLIAVLHANVGDEIGAHILQTCVTKFAEMFEQINEYKVENKELDNMLLLICHLYTFKICHHNLIYEIINKMMETLSEKSIECILLILKSIGFTLRKDNPTALKELITNIQRKSNEATPEIQNNSRCKYMLDILLAIRNNNVNKIPQYDPSVAESLRKMSKSMLATGKTVTTLNITLTDLLKADQSGKWWVVGSAWDGKINGTGDVGAAATWKQGDRTCHSDQSKFSPQLLELAEKQRMNTDDRRNVFCILMSADDYIESFEKLLQLDIKDHRVIITVIIHCCLSEKTFNPYYAILTQKFCDYNRKYQIAIQFAIWDRIKNIKSYTIFQIQNLVQFLLHLFESGGLALTILKIVDFGQLDKITFRFIRQIMMGLLLGTEETCKKVFMQMSLNTKIKGFKDSLKLFMHHFLVKGALKSGMTEEQMILLKKRIAIADKSLETTNSKIQF